MSSMLVSFSHFLVPSSSNVPLLTEAQQLFRAAEKQWSGVHGVHVVFFCLAFFHYSLRISMIFLMFSSFLSFIVFFSVIFPFFLAQAQLFIAIF